MLTLDETALVQSIGVDVNLNVVFVPYVKSILDGCWGGSPVLETGVRHEVLDAYKRAK
jgi:hypothetical protein